MSKPKRGQVIHITRFYPAGSGASDEVDDPAMYGLILEDWRMITDGNARLLYGESRWAREIIEEVLPVDSDYQLYLNAGDRYEILTPEQIPDHILAKLAFDQLQGNIDGC
jgi:hypothetical protein